MEILLATDFHFSLILLLIFLTILVCTKNTRKVILAKSGEENRLYNFQNTSEKHVKIQRIDDFMTVKIKKNCLKIIQIFCDKVRNLLPFCVFRIIQVFSV